MGFTHGCGDNPTIDGSNCRTLSNPRTYIIVIACIVQIDTHRIKTGEVKKMWVVVNDAGNNTGATNINFLCCGPR
ncbi:hypothetical protein D3C86_2136620 [compost metagenome]